MDALLVPLGSRSPIGDRQGMPSENCFLILNLALLGRSRRQGVVHVRDHKAQHSKPPILSTALALLVVGGAVLDIDPPSGRAEVVNMPTQQESFLGDEGVQHVEDVEVQQIKVLANVNVDLRLKSQFDHPSPLVDAELGDGADSVGFGLDVKLGCEVVQLSGLFLGADDPTGGWDGEQD